MYPLSILAIVMNVIRIFYIMYINSIILTIISFTLYNILAICIVSNFQHQIYKNLIVIIFIINVFNI